MIAASTRPALPDEYDGSGSRSAHLHPFVRSDAEPPLPQVAARHASAERVRTSAALLRDAVPMTDPRERPWPDSLEQPPPGPANSCSRPCGTRRRGWRSEWRSPTDSRRLTGPEPTLASLAVPSRGAAPGTAGATAADGAATGKPHRRPGLRSQARRDRGRWRHDQRRTLRRSRHNHDYRRLAAGRAGRPRGGRRRPRAAQARSPCPSFPGRHQRPRSRYSPPNRWWRPRPTRSWTTQGRVASRHSSCSASRAWHRSIHTLVALDDAGRSPRGSGALSAAPAAPAPSTAPPPAIAATRRVPHPLDGSAGLPARRGPGAAGREGITT